LITPTCSIRKYILRWFSKKAKVRSYLKRALYRYVSANDIKFPKGFNNQVVEYNDFMSNELNGDSKDWDEVI